MVTTRVYKSTDTSAPTLKGNVVDPNTDGSMANLFNKVLVAGYGVSTPAGWTRPFTGTNRAAFQQGAGSNGFYMRVNENIGGGFAYASVRGYESMATIDTSALPNNQGMFPQPTQGPLNSASGRAIGFTRSSSFDATARPWMMVANERFFYLWVNSSSTTYSTLNQPIMFCFGDIDPVTPAAAPDNYNTIIIGMQGSLSYLFDMYPGTMNGIQNSSFIARPYFQLPGCTAIVLSQSWPWQMTGVSVPGGVFDSIVFPNPVDNKMYLSKIGVYEMSPGGATKPVLRGYMPGAYSPMHLLTNGVGTQLTGINDESILTPSAAPLLGKVLTAKVHNTPAGAGTVFIETSNTWSYTY